MGRLDNLRKRLKRIEDFVARLPRWLEYVALTFIVVVVGTVTGHSSETMARNATVVVILLSIGNTVKWLSHRRQLRLSMRESARSPRP